MKTTKLLFLLILFFQLSLSGFAYVSIDSAPRGVVVGQPDQVGGAFSVTINGNDYYEASPELPILLRIRLSNFARFQETKVGWPLEDPNVSQFTPITLPMELIDAPDGFTLAAEQDSIAIVRWIAEENQIWLSFRRTSDEWIRTEQGELVPPSQNNGSIRFHVGLTELEYLEYYEPLFQANLANAPSIERWDFWQKSDKAQNSNLSTQLILNMMDSDLPVCPETNCYLRADTIYFQDTISNPQPADYIVFTYAFGGVPANIIPVYAVNMVNTPSLAYGEATIQTPALTNWKLWLFIVTLAVMCLFILRKGKVRQI